MSLFTALDLRPVERVVRIGKEDYRLDFDHLAISHAEQIYATQFDREPNGGIILTELLAGAMSALMAMVYGAIRSGGRAMSWETFSKSIWGMDEYDPMFDVASDAVIEMFGSMQGDAPELGEGDEKN